MPWQDYVFTIGQLLLAIGLIPTVLGRSKPALSTAIVSGSILLTFGFVFYTLSLWGSASMASVQAVLWLIIAYQKLSRRKTNAKAPRQQLKGSVRTVKNG